MPPPKARLHKNTGKLKSIPKVSQIPTNRTPSVSSNLAQSSSNPPEADRQFELELYWCIQQLENSLNAAHVRENNKKTEDTLKLINTLKSANQPLIKKRQIMRSTFGDYRAKMAEEEKTMTLNPESVRFDVPKKKAKYHFVKKAAILNEDNKEFRFNFSNIQLDDAEEQSEAAQPSTAATERRQESQMKPLKILPLSDNSFRFNFSVES
ncbi:UPF0488 protein CG14286 [Armigeres subalbatus]|uniref:UPF0488 protein CG14286 n=1 Tax=Armigeres subalbatus TaxID=124917 RepID=UPI002ED0FC05